MPERAGAWLHTVMTHPLGTSVTASGMTPSLGTVRFFAAAGGPLACAGSLDLSSPALYPEVAEGPRHSRAAGDPSVRGELARSAIGHFRVRARQL